MAGLHRGPEAAESGPTDEKHRGFTSAEHEETTALENTPVIAVPSTVCYSSHPIKKLLFTVKLCVCVCVCVRDKRTHPIPAVPVEREGESEL